eukprot:4645798-Prymnesium_polylepis.2
MRPLSPERTPLGFAHAALAFAATPKLKGMDRLYSSTRQAAAGRGRPRQAAAGRGRPREYAGSR